MRCSAQKKQLFLRTSAETLAERAGGFLPECGVLHNAEQNLL